MWRVGIAWLSLSERDSTSSTLQQSQQQEGAAVVMVAGALAATEGELNVGSIFGLSMPTEQ